MNTLNHLINQALSLDPDLAAKLLPYSGNVLAVELTDLKLTGYIQISDTKIILSNTEQIATTTLRGTSVSMMKLALANAENTMAVMHANHIEIEGDIEFSLAMKDVFSHIHIDWEEQLSHWTGDILAHQINEKVKVTHQCIAEFTHKGRHHFRDYLQEEMRVLPTAAEITDWSFDITQLIMDTDRVAARINRLQQWVQND